MAFAVLLDSCTLYPAHLRDSLLRLAERHFFEPLWTEEILSELSKALARSGIGASPVEHLLGEMREAFPEASIDGYQDLIKSMLSPDPADRHVLAAAVRANAGAIVTFNRRDFPPEAVELYEI